MDIEMLGLYYQYNMAARETCNMVILKYYYSLEIFSSVSIFSQIKMNAP